MPAVLDLMATVISSEVAMQHRGELDRSCEGILA